MFFLSARQFFAAHFRAVRGKRSFLSDERKEAQKKAFSELLIVGSGVVAVAVNRNRPTCRRKGFAHQAVTR